MYLRSAIFKFHNFMLDLDCRRHELSNPSQTPFILDIWKQQTQDVQKELLSDYNLKYGTPEMKHLCLNFEETQMGEIFFVKFRNVLGKEFLIETFGDDLGNHFWSKNYPTPTLDPGMAMYGMMDYGNKDRIELTLL